MTDTDWITDRPPTEADADEHGEVLAQIPSRMKLCPPSYAFTEWEQVPAGNPWRHTSMWKAAPAPATTPRKFTSITYANNRYIALADDGTAWENWHGHAWRQIHPLPAREVGQ